MAVALQRVAGVSGRKDVWWMFRGLVHASCPKCGYIQTMDGSPKEIDCNGCGKRSEIKLED